jgi:hypothetical protein
MTTSRFLTKKGSPCTTPLFWRDHLHGICKREDIGTRSAELRRRSCEPPKL